MEPSKEELTAELNTLKKEIVLAKEELKALTVKRIESVDYFKELQYKESNIKRKCAELGIKYE